MIKLFERVNTFLFPGGIFVFDVNTPYKHAQVLKDQTFVYETDSVYCVWQNEALDEVPSPWKAPTSSWKSTA